MTRLPVRAKQTFLHFLGFGVLLGIVQNCSTIVFAAPDGVFLGEVLINKYLFQPRIRIAMYYYWEASFVTSLYLMLMRPFRQEGFFFNIFACLAMFLTGSVWITLTAKGKGDTYSYILARQIGNGLMISLIGIWIWYQLENRVWNNVKKVERSKGL